MLRLSRRHFLKGLCSLPLIGVVPETLANNNSSVLVLVELHGGNDGLNTVVPYSDKLYYKLRPTIAVPKKKIITINNDLGLHPRLLPLMNIWNKGDIAIIQGVGYANPDRSHFRSIAIWDTANNKPNSDEGWIANQFFIRHPNSVAPVDAFTLGGSAGSVNGHNMRTVPMENPRVISRIAQQDERMTSDDIPSSLNHIYKLESKIADLGKLLDGGSDFQLPIMDNFPKNIFGRFFSRTAQLITADLGVPVVKLRVGGFDTHVNQSGRHSKLLSQFAESIIAFKRHLTQVGRWNDVLIITYSEFGRRPKENKGKGTDHGTAAPHFAIGGRVRGGLYGETPSLSKLEDGDLKYTVDFRRIYATVTQDWWGQPLRLSNGKQYTTLGFLKS
jgi:uncharacterized protein (DUF1501 family)